MKAWKKPIARLLALLIALAALTATLIVAQAAGDTMTTYDDQRRIEYQAL